MGSKLGSHPVWQCVILVVVILLVVLGIFWISGIFSETENLEAVLRERAGDSDPDIRLCAIRYAQKKKLPESFPVLVEALTDKDEKVVSAVKEALTEIGKPAVGILVKTLDSDDERLRLGSEQCLIKIGTPAVESLIEMLGTKNRRTQESAQNVLYRIGQSTKGPLKKAFEEGSPRVSIAAYEVILRFEKEEASTTRPSATAPK